MSKALHLNARLSGWGRRRGSVASPKTGGGLHFSRTEVGAIVLVAVVALGGVGFLTLRNNSSTPYVGVTETIQIYGPIFNSTVSIPGGYAEAPFTVAKGSHVSVLVQNTANQTHGLDIPAYNVDTGPIAPNGTATISFMANKIGNFTLTESKADCGGGNCDPSPTYNMTSWFSVIS